MRHIGSLLAGLVVAPLAWVLIAAGQPRTERTFERWSTSGSVYTGDVLGPLGLVIGAGVLLGLIVALRLSPVGPLVAGVFYLGVYVYAIREPTWVVDTLPQFSINGYRIDTVPPFTNGTMALAGAVLVLAAASRRRWQRWPAAGAADAGVAGPVAGGVAGTPWEPGAVPESPAPAGAYSTIGMPVGAAVYTPNEVVAGPPPAVGEGPLWPSSVAGQPEQGSTLTRESMFAGLTPGTAEDLPRRTPPKRPTPAEAGPPAELDNPPADTGPAAGRTPTTPVIPSPRHAAVTEGWPLDSWPATDSADRPTIQPTFQVPPDTPSSELTQPVPAPAEQPASEQPASEQPVDPTAESPEGQAGPPPRPVNPLASQRPTSPPPSGPPRPRPVNPLAQRPAGPTGDPSDATQRLPGQPAPEEEPTDPPASPWAGPPRPPQDS